MDPHVKSYDELIDSLEKQELSIQDRPNAIKTLKTISYYSLYNGYKKLFMLEGEKKFKPNTTIEHLILVYHFDYELQNILFKFIIRYEILIKNAISDVVAKFGKCHKDYLLPKNYRDPRSDRTLRTVKELSDWINSTTNTPTSYYRKYYSSVPPWMATKNMYLGHIESWYRILKSSDKIELGRSFLPNEDRYKDEDIIKFLNVSFSVIRNYRNIFAHGNRTLSYVSSAISFQSYNLLDSILPRGVINQKDFYKKKYLRNDLLALSVILMLSFPNKFDITQFYLELENIFIKFLSIDAIKPIKAEFFNFINLPQNIMSRLEKIVLQ